MRHGDDRAFVFAQMMFEPRHGFSIEMIGGSSSRSISGSVSSKRVSATRRRSPPEQTLMAYPPATAQSVHGEIKMAVEIPRIHLIELLLQFRLLGHQRIEVRIGFGKFGVDFIESFQHFDDGLHRLFHHLDHSLRSSSFGSCSSKPTVYPLLMEISPT